MSDYEKREYIENEMTDSDLYTETQLDAIEGLIYDLAELNNMTCREQDEAMVESLEKLFSYTTGWDIDYPENEEEEE